MQTKSTKIYASVLGLAAAAFGVDRWVIGHADAAEASPATLLVAPATPAAASLTPGLSADARQELSVEALSARLQLAAASHGATADAAADAFKPARAWAGEKPIPQPQAQAAPAEPARDPAAEFRRRHKLNAVIRRGQGGAAVIDGKMLTPGQTLDGFKLLRVGPRSAELESDGHRVEMVLEAGSI